MRPIQLFDPDSCTYTYVLFDAPTRAAVIIDPVDEQLERDLRTLRDHGLRLQWVVETHAHADHITSALKLAEHTGARTAAPAACGIVTVHRPLHDGDELTFGSQRLQALATPGHTAGSMSYVWRVDDQVHVFTGDTLLIEGCGRTDFQSGDPVALYRSITERLFTLPDEAIVWPGHDYRGRTHSTIGHEKKHNPRLAGKSLEQFVALMQGLNLPRPRRIDEAVPANLRGGVRHDVDGAEREQPRPAAGYAGDVAPELAWRWVQEGRALLVDVRTDAEREWVGYVPGAHALAWKQWPGMQPNPAFDDGVRALAAQGRPLLMLCRSGARSIAAAKRATELGAIAYNVLEGFEGDLDAEGHRGQLGGWRHRGLPWRQN
ncbi:MAG: MBL fold metallo-hydrolase [Tepidimonas sp.]|uniref:MBL fold metallo-hydrolase n=1 Tax=Tepidimonas sp. TaxID=2002775 RepID=UPI00298F016F|nr:MBL fold metallo-hydrolase [Tepidimonas sp.]MCS6810338.1 MBL fold metallo-hydrolase [Tepidimonas sp.]MDW8337122.1 MBL fold metallo-hydrolase [Tepidimonas sp.]